MSMSSFRAVPRAGHLKTLKRIFGYVLKMKHTTTRFKTSLPDHSQHCTTNYEWEKTFYCNTKELVATNIPRPLGPKVTTTMYIDANLCHDMLSKKSVTGIMNPEQDCYTFL